MLKPRSYTCEDVIEIHTHGGGVCALRVLQACLGQGARQALAGEFTMRAFLNGRLTLAQVTHPCEECIRPYHTMPSSWNPGEGCAGKHVLLAAAHMLISMCGFKGEPTLFYYAV